MSYLGLVEIDPKYSVQAGVVVAVTGWRGPDFMADWGIQYDEGDEVEEEEPVIIPLLVAEVHVIVVS